MTDKKNNLMAIPLNNSIFAQYYSRKYTYTH
jgi:hypothetical protein